MSLEKILAISGKPGLYELKMQTRTGFIAESLLDGKKITAGLRSNVSLLSEIQMYAYTEEVRLYTIFKNIAEKEAYGTAPSDKESETVLNTYFREVFPEYDQDRVYVSDIKKALRWYNILQAKGYITAENFTDFEQKINKAETTPETTE